MRTHGPRRWTHWVLLAIALASPAALALAGPGSQVYELDEGAHGGFADTLLLYTTPAPTPGGTLTVNGGDCIVFAHANAASGPLTWPEEGWTIELFAEGALGHEVLFEIGSMDTGPQTGVVLTFEAGETEGVQRATATTSGPGMIAVGDGDHLAAALCSTGPATSSFTLLTGGSSTFTSPSTAPVMPVPELSSLVLFGMGALLVALVAVRRRPA